MPVSAARLRDIYDRSSGYCHICGKKLAFSNYSVLGARGSWEIEHSVARVRGGTDRLSNLYAACIRCNRQKQHLTTRTARRWHGRTRAPLSVSKRKTARTEAGWTGAALGFLLAAPFGGAAALVGPLIGGYLGHRRNPDGS
jgi:5-methylcytosine-specific restriction endonuclease McrA